MLGPSDASARPPMELGAAPLSLGDLSERLLSEGYGVCEGAAAASWCSSVASEVSALHTVHSLLLPSLNRVATSRGQQPAGHAALPPTGVVCHKEGVFELDLVYEGRLCRGDALDKCPALHAWWHGGHGDALCAQINAAAPWLQLTHVDTVKLQFNEGRGGCFPFHFDTTAETSGRTLTAILYLADSWEPSHGGQLRLLPFPLAPIDIAPLAGRLVLFSSTATLHRVLPAAHPRCVLSIWCAGAKEPLFPSRYPGWVASAVGGDATQLLAFLRTPSNARLLCKVLYADEWAASIRDAFGKDGAGVAEAVALHYREVEDLRRRINAPLLALLQDAIPFTAPQEGGKVIQAG